MFQMTAIRACLVAAVFGAAVSAALAQTPAAALTKPVDPQRAWVGMKTGADLDNWAQWHLAEERKCIAQLLSVTGARTVENTLEPYDEAQRHLALAGGQVGSLFATAPQKDVRDHAQALDQVVAAAGVELNLNQDVFKALSGLDVSQADPATKYYVQRTLLEYRLAGVDKDAATRARIKQLQDKATELSNTFNRNVQDDVRKVKVKSAAQLDGLPADYIARHKPAADGSIVLTTDSPDMGPVLSYAKDRQLRLDMFLAYTNRAYPANQQVLLDLFQVRQELAHTLGFTTWVDLATADQMMGSSAKLKAFLNEVDAASRPVSDREFAELKEFVSSKDPSAMPLMLSDSSYWNEQFRRTKYDFNSQSVRPYFPYDEVEKGVLNTAAALFHIEFRRDESAPVWDPSVHAYDVYDGGKPAGRIYLDMHPREGKDKWFNESALIPGKLGVELPEARLVCNFSGGVAGDPGLMQFGEVVTFFHEFGHMMHDVLGGKQRWAGQAGVSTEGDFVEAPSQMLEEFFHDRRILQSFAKNYQTGETLPTELIVKMNRANEYGRGSWALGQTMYATYSYQVHDYSTGSPDLAALEKQDLDRFSHYQFVPGMHMYAAFTHLADYTSNYYTYVLDKVIAVDFFSQFDKSNLLEGPTTMRYRRAILEPGGSKPAAQLVQDFLGRPQNLDAMKAWMNQQFETK